MFEYLGRIKGPWDQRELEDVLLDGLHMLDIAADLDSATGGFSKTPPIVRVLDRNGNRPVDEKVLARAVKSVLNRA